MGTISLGADGTVSFDGLPKELVRTLTEDGALSYNRKRYFPRDGRKFLIACIAQFSGGYIRATPMKE